MHPSTPPWRRLLIVAVDLDGTISFEGRAPSEDVMAALTEVATTPGVRLVLVTSSSPRIVRPWFPTLRSRMDLVCCHGAVWVRPGGVRWVCPLDPDAVETVLDRLERAGACYAVDHGHAFTTRSDCGTWGGVAHRTRTADPDAIGRDGVLRICVDDPGTARTASAGVKRATVFPHASGRADIVAAGTDKANPIQVMRTLDSPASVHVFGDDENDRRLLRLADQGYIVGDRMPELDRHAHIARITADDVPRRLRALLSPGMTADWT